jgi:hypothetical protein
LRPRLEGLRCFCEIPRRSQWPITTTLGLPERVSDEVRVQTQSAGGV